MHKAKWRVVGMLFYVALAAGVWWLVFASWTFDENAPNGWTGMDPTSAALVFLGAALIAGGLATVAL